MSFLFSIVKINGSIYAGVKSSSFDRREQQLPGAADGTVHVTTSPVVHSAPRAGFSLLGFRTLFAALTAGQVPYLALDGSNGWAGIALKRGTTPGWDSGSTHIERKMARGMLLLDGVTWQPGQPAEAACSVFGLSSDGSADPVASASVALPTLPTLQEQLGLSTLTVNGVSLTKVMNLQIGIAHQVENNAADCYLCDLPHPTALQMPGAGGAAEITASIDTKDFDATIANGNLVATFKVLNHNGVGLSANTAVVTIATAVARETQIDRDTRRIELRGTWNGSTNPITLATA